MTFNRFKVLTFDIVGTLIDFETGILNAFREIGEKASEHLTDDQIFAPYVEARTKYIGRYTDIMHDVYLHVARDLKLPETEAAAKHFQASILAWPAFKDSCDALKRLRQRYRLVAMTNSDRVHYSSYAQTLGDPFHDSVTLDEGRFAKPDHRFFFYT
ncbi:MAG: HAD family hydrolase, partial [Afipia sp.]|nr:HAD family hydrolase [Afipia sp.]